MAACASPPDCQLRSRPHPEVAFAESVPHLRLRMSETTRPGGLTALAVLHFVFGGKRIADTVGFVVLRSRHDQMDDDKKPRELVDALAAVDATVFTTISVLAVLTGLATIAAGIGCLKLRARLGRRLGTVAALSMIGMTIAYAMLLRGTRAGDFTLLTVVQLLFPLLTLFLLNVTFKDEFVR